MIEVVAVFVCDIPVYMVQKYLVENNHYHQMIDNLYNKVFFFFYFVEKMDNFHYDPVGCELFWKFTEVVDVIGLSQY